MSVRKPISPQGLSSNPAFAPAVQVGELLFISGQVAQDNEGNLVGPGDCGSIVMITLAPHILPAFCELIHRRGTPSGWALLGAEWDGRGPRLVSEFGEHHGCLGCRDFPSLAPVLAQMLESPSRENGCRISQASQSD